MNASSMLCIETPRYRKYNFPSMCVQFVFYTASDLTGASFKYQNKPIVQSSAGIHHVKRAF